MGNRICGRLAANRQARIERRNSHCCQPRVYYCNRPQVQCQPVYQQPVYSQPQAITQQLQSAPQTKTDIDLDFKSINTVEFDSSSSLGQWLNEQRQHTEINMFNVGDVHIMEVRGNSPKLQFFDKNNL